jgi:hypothetical protein
VEVYFQVIFPLREKGSCGGNGLQAKQAVSRLKIIGTWVEYPISVFHRIIGL